MKHAPFASLFAGRTALGSWSQIDSADCIDMLGAAGYHFTILDCEHGALDMGSLPGLVRACEAAGLMPWARAPGADAAWIGKALDTGVRGIVLPGVDSTDELARIVQATRFAPAGRRGACPIVRSGGHVVDDWAAYASREDAAVGVVALVETPAGVQRIDALCAVPGLAALMLGPFDLSVAMGHGGDLSAPPVLHALQHMLDVARARGLAVVVPVFDSDPAVLRRQAQDWLARGATALTIGADKLFFLSAARQGLHTVLG